MTGGDETQPFPDVEGDAGFQEPPTIPWQGVASGTGTHWPRAASPAPAPQRRDVSPLIWLLAGGIVVVMVALLALLLGGRIVGTSTTSGQHGTTAPTVNGASSPTVGPTATRQIASCAEVPDYANAGPASTSNRHITLPFPARSVSISGGADVTHLGYQLRVLRVCTPHVTVSSLPMIFGQQVTAAGWQSVQSPVLPQGIACGTSCWQFKAPPVNSQSQARYLFFAGLNQPQQMGDVVTYTVQLVIAPYTSGSGTFDVLHSTFSADQGPDVDLQYLSGQQVILVDNALYAPIPGNQFDITYHDLSALDYTNNQGMPFQLNQGATIGLQANSGSFCVLQVTQVSATNMSYRWYTFPYGI